jgi:hypothetical protein
MGFRFARNRRNPYKFRLFTSFLRFPADARVFMLRRILRRFCAGFCAAYCLLEMGFGRLGIVFETHLGIVSHPQGDDVIKERGLPGRLPALGRAEERG